MKIATQYRDIATKFEREASATTLPRAREHKMIAANYWKDLARKQDNIARGI